MFNFFLSYQSNDKSIVENICQTTENIGHKCWFAPRDIEPGREYQSAVVEAIKSCDAMIVVISNNTHLSEYVPMEVERATHYKKAIFPIKIEDTTLPPSLELFLASKQWYDLFQPSSLDAIENLLSSILNSNHLIQVKSKDAVAEDSKGQYVYEYPRPSVTADIILFGISLRGDLSVLLIKRGLEPYKDYWALPGGFVRMDESLLQAATRELEEETGVIDVSLEQFAIYDDVNRDPRTRVITSTFLGVCNPGLHNIEASTDASKAAWHSVEKIPKLAFDHSIQIEKGLMYLNESLNKIKSINCIFPEDTSLFSLNVARESLNNVLRKT